MRLKKLGEVGTGFGIDLELDLCWIELPEQVVRRRAQEFLRGAVAWYVAKSADDAGWGAVELAAD
jgi:hypothetical protein